MTKLTIQSIVQHFLYIKYDLSSIIYRIFNDALLIINFNLDTFSLLIIANYFLFIIQSLYLLIYKKYARFNKITIRTYNVRFLGYPIRAFTTLRPLRVLCKRLTTVFAHYGLPFKRVYIFFFT